MHVYVHDVRDTHVVLHTADTEFKYGDSIVKIPKGLM